MKLIVNADDFGYSKGVNRGIQAAFQNGIVRSCTIMANMPGFIHGVALLKANPAISCGVHLNLTRGLPLTREYPHTNADGTFLRHPVFMPGEEPLILAELTAQIERLRATGIEPTHLDSHHHIHNAPFIAPLVQELAEAYRLPLRPYGVWQREDTYLSTGFFGDTTQDMLLKELQQGLDSGRPYMELMCHPGFADRQLCISSSYSHGRAREVRLLCSSETQNFIQDNDITLCSYREYQK